MLHLLITCGAAVMRHQSATTFMTQFESFHHRGFTTDADFDFRFDRFQGDDAFEDNQRNEFRIDVVTMTCVPALDYQESLLL